jgi:hypothetical protein
MTDPTCNLMHTNDKQTLAKESSMTNSSQQDTPVTMGSMPRMSSC